MGILALGFETAEFESRALYEEPFTVALPASLLRMDGGEGPSYLVYGNFRVLMAWNRSTYFGVSVGLLSDSLKDG